jgi:N-acetylglucosaminyldiphosphoundecaprenol N-acetyl-beta-D-mannosaminyltransferase
VNAIPEYPKANILGIGVDAVNMNQAVARIAHNLRQQIKGYVCLCNVYGVMEAKRNPSLAKIYAAAALAAPDGMPTVWVGRCQGLPMRERVAGPDLMLELMNREDFRGYTHFFCGGKPGVAEELRERLVARYPWVQIIGTHTPPFRPMSRAEEKEFIARINDLRPDIIWVGISTPKQERFMARYLGSLDTTLMIGVGAAFDFHTGRIADCAQWIKSAGLQWLHRLLQDPKHLWKRYLRNNPAFIFHIALQLTGLKSYPLRSPTQSLDALPQAAWNEPRSVAR